MQTCAAAEVFPFPDPLKICQTFLTQYNISSYFSLLGKIQNSTENLHRNVLRCWGKWYQPYSITSNEMHGSATDAPYVSLFLFLKGSSAHSASVPSFQKYNKLVYF